MEKNFWRSYYKQVPYYYKKNRYGFIFIRHKVLFFGDAKKSQKVNLCKCFIVELSMSNIMILQCI